MITCCWSCSGGDWLDSVSAERKSSCLVLGIQHPAPYPHLSSGCCGLLLRMDEMTLTLQGKASSARSCLVLWFQHPTRIFHMFGQINVCILNSASLRSCDCDILFRVDGMVLPSFQSFLGSVEWNRPGKVQINFSSECYVCLSRIDMCCTPIINLSFCHGHVVVKLINLAAMAVVVSYLAMKRKW